MKYRIIIFSLLFCTSVSAQQKWTLVSTFSNNPIPFFYNENYGFVLSQYNGTRALFRTTDGGAHWQHIDVVGYDGAYSYPVYLTNIYLDSPRHLYANDSYSSYESVDSGLTWMANSVYRPGLVIQNDILYSSDGTHSTDDGATWSKDLSSFWGSTYNVIGNKENGVACFSGGIKTLDDGTLYTTDNGLTWAVGEHKDFGIGYAIPHTLSYFRLCSELRVAPPYPKNSAILDSNIILRSTNGGATWQKIFPNTAPPYSLGATFTGSGSVIFAQLTSKYTSIFDSTGGVIRSVNFGKSWDTIGGPRNPENTNPGMSAVSRGAICFAGDYFGKLWKFVDSSLLRNATWDLTVQHSSISISHDTLFARTCDSARLIINYGFKGSDYVKLDDIIIEGISSSEYRADFTKDKVIMSGRADTSGISFLPFLPGTYPIKIHSFIMRDDWVREDTVFTLTLVVKPNPAVLSLAASNIIDFGSQILC
ncbi:MAG: WD40/YVTN/BNR-like repeat-containing protein, partial [Candidatus Kapaibacterium sp.]